MGNRLLKESIRFNRRIDELDWFEEVMFYRLITAADDYGVFYADPVVLARILFPLKKGVDDRMTAKALKKLEAVGLVRLYRAGNEEWLMIVSWKKHQRLRNSRHNYPVPEGWTPEDPVVRDAPDAAAPRPEESKPEQESVPEAAAEVREVPVIELPLNDNTAYGVTQAEVNEYAALYPAVDVIQELRKMRGWCLASPQKRKTRSGILKFINSWMAREQDRGGSSGGPAGKDRENIYQRMAMQYEAEEQANASRTAAEGGSVQ